MKFYAALYQLALYLYFAAVRVFALFNGKAKLFVDGRRHIFAQISLKLTNETRPSIWMHCASLGEFEQGRPVLEALGEAYPQYAIILTFFSPSGYEVRKNYSGADYVFYLPMDSDANAKQLLDLFSPALCIFVKYEFWYGYLTNIAARNIPVILISAIFNKEQGFFKWYGTLQRHMLHCFSHIFVQDENSVELLHRIHIDKITISGDTRFDRVITAATQIAPMPLADSFIADHQVLVAGSTWKEDEILLQKAMELLPASWRLVLVPHEVDKEHIDAIQKLYGTDTILWSQATVTNCVDKRVLIVDQVGLLMQLYRYGSIAWIGGGFGKEGVHNVLEAAVYGIPCFYGPVFHQFLEAAELIDKGGAFSVSDPADLASSIRELDDTVRYDQHAQQAKNYVLSKAGATKKILEYLGNTRLHLP
jgi:3-deoxy-D-manno-octulosonic-acid transferase